MRRSVFVWFFLALLLLSLRVWAVASHLRARASHLRMFASASHLLTILHTHLLLMLAAHLLLMLRAHLLLMMHLLIHCMRPVTGTLVFH